MSDHLMRGYRVQLTTTMDSVLRTALFEVMKIFENALHDHKIQLAQKGEEISQLKMKLQRAELKLKDLELGCPREAENSQTQKQAPDVPDGPGWSSQRDVAAAPDDWCAPLGFETVTKQEVNLYPNVKLRPFSIRLNHVPVKTEMVNHPINLQRNEHTRRSERISVLNAKSEKVLNKSESNCDQGHQSPVQRCGVDVLLRDVRHIYSDLSGLERLRKRKINSVTLPRKSKEKPIGQRNSTAKESTSTDHMGAKTYNCRYCKKVFVKESGLRAHVHYHKKCPGCKKLFRYVESVKFHKELCAKYKKRMENKVRKPPKTSSKEVNEPAPCETQITIKEEPTETPVNYSAEFPLRHTCRVCSCTFRSKVKLDKHMRVHSVNAIFCSMCPRAFLSIGALRVHVTKRHQQHAHVFDTKEDLGWTRPLEDIDEN